jgi:hypothetical protein
MVVSGESLALRERRFVRAAFIAPQRGGGGGYRGRTGTAASSFFVYSCCGRE